MHKKEQNKRLFKCGGENHNVIQHIIVLETSKEKKDIWTHLNVQSIYPIRGGGVKTCRWEHRLYRHKPFMRYHNWAPPMGVVSGQQYNTGEKAAAILYTYDIIPMQVHQNRGKNLR